MKLKCECGHTIPWRRSMTFGIMQICPKCGAWWKPDGEGLHITRIDTTPENETLLYYQWIPINEIWGNAK